MTLPVAVMSAFLAKDALEDHFTGGMAGFRLAYPGLLEDEALVRMCAMCWEDLEAQLVGLRALGVPVEGNFAVGDFIGGALLRCDRIAIECPDEDGPPSWSARLIY